MEIVPSVRGVPIRLTGERWFHIVENHDELAGMASEVTAAVAEPDRVVSGWRGEMLAIRKIGAKYLVVAYREMSEKDGFIITAFLTAKIGRLRRRKILWQKQS